MFFVEAPTYPGVMENRGGFRFFCSSWTLARGDFTPTPVKMHKVYEQQHKKDREGEEMGS